MYSIRLIRAATGRLALIVETPPGVEPLVVEYLTLALQELASDLASVMEDVTCDSSRATSELSLEKSAVSKLICDLEEWLNDQE